MSLLSSHTHSHPPIPLDMSSYAPLAFDREAVSSSTSASSLAQYGLGPGAYGTGRGNDPYAVAAIPKRPPPPTSVSSQSHSFIQTPYQASLVHPSVNGEGQGQGLWPAVGISHEQLTAMGVSMPSIGEVQSIGRGKRRALPPLPTGVPIQPPPAWEPDMKAHIPASLINPSIEHAYASLSGPAPTAGPSHTPAPNEPPALDPRRPAEHGINLHANAQTPIWSTHYLDPALDDACVLLPPTATSTAAAGSSVSKRKRRASSAQPIAIGGVWDVPPDGRFIAEDGAVDLTLGVVDSKRVGGMPGERTKAKIEVISRDGEVKVDLLDIAPTRQVELNVNTRSGDILILLPRAFHGSLTTLHATSHPPTYLPSLRSNLSHQSSSQPGRSTAFLTSPTHVPSLTTRPDLGERRYSQRIAIANASAAGDSRVNVMSFKGRIVYGIHGEDEASLGRWAGMGGSGVAKDVGRRKRRGIGRLFGGK